MPPKKFAIKGTIVPSDYQELYDWIGWEATSPAKIEAFLEEAKGADIILEVNSPGGYVFAGMEIYNRLKMYSGKITAVVLSIAASAASLIICAADTVQMSPVSQLMIHRTHSWTEGDKNDMYKTADDLAKLDESIANAYVDKTGLSKDEVLKLMDVTTWMGAEEAKEKNFADEILFQQEEQPAAAAYGIDMANGASCSAAIMLTSEQIARMREAMMAKQTVNKQQETAALNLLMQKYNYLSLKGEN